MPSLKLSFLILVIKAQLKLAPIAQLVEQRIENPRVPGSNPGRGTIYYIKNLQFFAGFFYLSILKNLVISVVDYLNS